MCLSNVSISYSSLVGTTIAIKYYANLENIKTLTQIIQMPTHKDQHFKYITKDFRQFCQCYHNDTVTAVSALMIHLGYFAILQPYY